MNAEVYVILSQSKDNPLCTFKNDWKLMLLCISTVLMQFKQITKC